MNRIKDELNKGVTLRSYWKQVKTPGEDDFMLLASLIKAYCHELKEPAFTEDISRKIIAVEESSSGDSQKLEYFRKVFYTLPTVSFTKNYYF